MDALKIANIDGLRLEYRIDNDQGQGGTILLCNPLGGDLSVWDAVTTRLTVSGYRTIRYNHRGHGGTTIPSEPCTFNRLAQDCVELLDALQVHKLVAFIGISMGGATTVHFAAKYHGRCSHYIVCDAPVSGTPGPSEPFGPRIATAKTQGMDVLAQQTAERWLSPEYVKQNPEGFARTCAMVARVPVDGYIAKARALQDFDLRPLYKQVDPDATYTLIVGELDGPTPALMKTMAEALPGPAANHVIKGAGHLPMIDAEAAYIGLLEDALRRG